MSQMPGHGICSVQCAYAVELAMHSCLTNFRPAAEHNAKEQSICRLCIGAHSLPRSRSTSTKALRRGSACCASGELRAAFKKDSR